MAIAAKTEPRLETAPPEMEARTVEARSVEARTADARTAENKSVVAVPASAPAPMPHPVASAHQPEPSRLDQLSRVEDKVARIEEKFARAEERMMRVESALEKATIRLEGATQDMNMKAVNEELAAIKAQVRRKPGVAGLFLVTLITALAAAAAGYALARYGVPGLLPPR